jgi:hypothetical protein
VSKLASTLTSIRIITILTSQLTQFPLISLLGIRAAQKALRFIPDQTNRASTLAIDAQLGPIIALCLVGLGFWLGTLGGRAIAGGTERALRLLPALIPRLEGDENAAVWIAARTLARTALGMGSSTASLRRLINCLLIVRDNPRIATSISALIRIKSTVTLLANLDNFIATESALGHLKAVPLLALLDRVQHIRNVPDRALREFTVVWTVSAGRTRKHYKVSWQSSGATFQRIIVRRAEIVADFMGQRQLGHLWRDSTVVVHEGYDAGVQGTLRALIHAGYGFGVGFVFFADPSGGSRC